jgi:hypothetical protein
MSNQYYDSPNSRVKDLLYSLGFKKEPAVQSAMVKETTEKTTPKNPDEEIPVEQIEEAEQDAADPTHEKEIPPQQ